eukprot:6209635-Pleurochrysis_carterae.AAC.2
MDPSMDVLCATWSHWCVYKARAHAAYDRAHKQGQTHISPRNGLFPLFEKLPVLSGVILSRALFFSVVAKYLFRSVHCFTYLLHSQPRLPRDWYVLPA